MKNLFTYGSLMCNDIMQIVSGMSAPHQKGLLDGYYRSQILGETYPAIVAQPGRQVEGVVYFNLSANALAKLDTFEGAYYTREEITVTCENMQLVSAMAYILKPDYHHILNGKPWNFNSFLATGKKEFLTNYVGFDKI